MSDRVNVWAYTAGWRIVRLLPERVAYLIFSVIAQFIWLRQGQAARQLELNLSRVVPELSPMRLEDPGPQGAPFLSAATTATPSGCPTGRPNGSWRPVVRRATHRFARRSPRVVAS